MASEIKKYPTFRYHHRLAPKGKIFHSAEETANLESEGWVDTPAKFPKPSERALSDLRLELDDAETEYRRWTSDGASSPHSNRWEEVTAKYQVARDRYDFALREAEIASNKTTPEGAKKKLITFETTFEKFTVRALLGQGGAGKVYDVQDENGASWAIKCLDPTALTKQHRKRFKNEIEFCSKNTHPNIVPVEDWGLTDISGNRVPFYVMPRFESTLRIQMRKGIEHNEILPLFNQILDGLEAAHQAHVWHRDLKPENILYDSSGPRVVIADFGIAHYTEVLLRTAIKTAQGDRLANFQYAAPEQRSFSIVDQRADIYSLGLILNEMFTGAILQGTNHKTIETVAPSFAYLDPLVHHMVRQSPDDRIGSIAKIRAALAGKAELIVPTALKSELASSEPTGAEPSPAAGPMARVAEQPSANNFSNDSDDVFERLKLFIFGSADPRYPDSAHFDVNQLANQFSLSVGYIQEILEELDAEGLVIVAKWDGKRERPISEWPSSAAFFQHTGDGGYLRLKMRRRGKQQFERMKAAVR